jgi:organic radical activating enzyme
VSKYYCSQKFWWLTVEPQKRSMASCCAAELTKIDLDWIKSNPGQLFNTPQLQHERQQMLDGQVVSSCYNTCWRAEEQGLPSRRILMGSDQVNETAVIADPSVLNINLGTDCNLTCSYCGKYYSTAWLRDVNEHGIYLDEGRFNLTANDKIILNLGQKKIKESDVYNLILDEAIKLKRVEKVEITGGEPFLYNGLVDLVTRLYAQVYIYTGLGVNNARFKEILLKLPKNVILTVSAENIGELYEFNRYGNSYENFINNLNTIKELGFNYHFSSVISNLTIHGYKQFRDTLGTELDVINFCADPEYLNVNVLDDTSKEIINQVDYNKLDVEIKNAVNTNCTAEQKIKLKTYLIEFARRRQLSLEVFPESFRDWL